MKEIKNTSKLGRHFINRWLGSKDVYLEQVYKKPSDRKRRAWEYCVRKCSDMYGMDFRIIGANCNVFTVAWVCSRYLIVKTHRNTYKIKLP